MLTECAQPGWASNCNGAIDTAQAYINNTLPGALSTLYASIKSKAPTAKVVVVGYPRIFNGEDCNAGTWFSPAEETRLNQTADLINTKLSSAAGGEGLHVRQPDQPLRRPRGLRQPRVAQRPVQPDQRELPPQPDRTRLRLHAAGQPAADRRSGPSRPRPRRAGGPAGKAQAALQRQYADQDRSIQPQSFVAPDLTTREAKVAARKAGINLKRWIARH